MRLLILILPCILYGSGFCLFERLTVGADALGLSNSIVAYPFSPFAIYYNQANMAYQEKTKSALNIRTFYGIPEILQGDMCFTARLLAGTFGGAISFFGNRLYREYRLLIAGALWIDQRFRIGLGTTVYYLSIAGYGQTLTAGINISFASQIGDHFYYGAMIRNLNQPVITASREPLPQSFDLGVCFRMSEELFFLMDVYKENRFKPEIGGGIGFRPVPVLIIRSGIADGIESFSMGFGLKLTKFSIDYGISVHPVLDISHAISVIIEI